MTEKANSGSWVEIQRIVLGVGERAPQVPDDTRRLPLEMRVRGHLVNDAAMGDEVTIVSLAGRRLSGTLVAVNPEYPHRFGAPVPELSRIGSELRDLLRVEAS